MTDHRIIPRAEWEAEPAGGMAAASYPMGKVWLHHSVTTPTDDPAADMRLLQEIGISRGFSDVSYTFALHPSGAILEGRELQYVGAHTAGNNSSSLAFVLIGNYTSTPPTAEQIDAARWLRDHLIDEGYLTPGTYPTGGHQDAPGNSTECPGAAAEDRLDLFRAPQDTNPQPVGDPHMLTFRYIFDGLDWVFDGPSRLFFQCDDTRQITEVLDPLGVKALGQVSDSTHKRYSTIAETAGFTG
jgi:hypothetical protein